jgi:hypothetical protein
MLPGISTQNFRLTPEGHVMRAISTWSVLSKASCRFLFVAILGSSYRHIVF